MIRHSLALTLAWLTLSLAGADVLQAESDPVASEQQESPEYFPPPSDSGVQDDGTTSESDQELIAFSMTGVEDEPDPGVDENGEIIPPEVRSDSTDDPSIDEPLENVQDDNPEIYYMFGSGGSFANMATTRNGLVFAAALDGLDANVGTDLELLMQGISDLSSSAFQSAALNALAGESYASVQSVGVQIGDRALRSVSERLINTPALLNGGDALLAGRRLQLDAENALVRGQSPFVTAAGWVQGYGVSGDIDGGAGVGDTDYRLGGFSVGVDLARDEADVVGITGGVSWSTFQAGGVSDGDVNSFQIGAYAFKQLEDLGYAMAIAQYGHLDYEVRRNVIIGPLLFTPRSHFTGDAFQSYGEVGTNLDWAPLRFQPFAGLQYQLLANGSAVEQGGGPANLRIADDSINSLFSHVGGRVILNGWQHRSGAVLTPYLNARWMWDLVGDGRTLQAGLAASPGAVWTVSGARPGRHYGMFGPGVLLRLSDFASIYANYDLQVAERFTAHTGSGGLLIQF